MSDGLPAPDEAAQAVIVSTLGLCFGSFFNVLIARLPNDESIIRPGSKCPKCGRALAWYENVPVLSWVALLGKCRSCKAPISVRYPAVEVITGLLFFAFWWRLGWTYTLVAGLVMASFLVPLAFIDAEHWILPFELTLPGIAAGVLLRIPTGWEAVKAAAIGAAIGFCAFRAVEYFGWLAFKKEAMGAGDKYLAALICAYLGGAAMPGLLLLSALQGSVFGLLSIAISGRAGPEHEKNEAEAAQKEEAPPTMTWELTKPGLPLWRRLVLIPYCIFIQPIPDEPKDVEGNEVEWKPGATNLPFGPWLALAALELALIGPWLGAHVPMIGWAFSIVSFG